MASIHLFFEGKGTSYEELMTRNGDVIISKAIRSSVKLSRNGIWYLTVKFPESLLNGRKLTSESVFRTDIGFIRNQLFRMLYPKYNKKEKTYECYCNHIFFDAKYECMPIDKTHKCNNTDETPYNERWSWDRAIQEINTIAEYCKANPGRYKVIGVSPEPEFFDTTPEVGELFYILWKYSPDINKCWDVTGAATGSGAPIAMYTRLGLVANRNGFNLAQVFALTPSKSGVEGEYNIRNYTSYLYANINGGVAVDGATIMIFKDSKDDVNERFTFETLEKGGCLIHAAMDPTFVVSRGEPNWNNDVQLRLRSSDQNPEGFTYVFSYNRYKADIDFNDQNIIESMFGTSQNSMLSAFSTSVDRTHTTAMINNYTCYFGDMSKYPDVFKPKEIVISNRFITQDTMKESVEERIDAIIPISGSGTRANSSDSRAFVKSSDYDKHSVHRVAQVKYDELKLVDDGGDITTEDALWSALEGRAKADIESGVKRFNTIESELSIVDIVTSGNPVFKDLKLNDILYKENSDGTREKYYIEEYEYDPIAQKIKNIKVVREGE